VLFRLQLNRFLLMPLCHASPSVSMEVNGGHTEVNGSRRRPGKVRRAATDWVTHALASSAPSRLWKCGAFAQRDQKRLGMNTEIEEGSRGRSTGVKEGLQLEGTAWGAWG